MQERIKQLRKKLGLSQGQFAAKIGKTPGFISLIENGRSGVSEETIEDIAKVFHVNVDWLSEGQGEMFIDEAPQDGSEPFEGIDKAGIADRMKRLRNERNMTISQFAAEIPCSRDQIVRIENGDRIPSEKFLKRVADALFVSLNWLLTGEEKSAKDVELDRIMHYMAKDSVAREVVLEAMDKDRSIWLELDRVIRDN